MGKREKLSSEWENYRRSNLGSLAGLDLHTPKRNARSVPISEPPKVLILPVIEAILCRNERLAGPYVPI